MSLAPISGRGVRETVSVMILLDPNAKCEILDEDAPRMP
jgi:hypothetical protein